MAVSKTLEIINNSLWHPSSKTLIISDIHLGYEEYMHSKGIFTPKSQYKIITENLEKILQQVTPETIIINGDLKHDFGTILRQEWNDVLQLIDLLKTKCQKVIIIKGNHDNILPPITDKKDIVIKEFHIIDDIIILHGDKLINSDLLTSIETKGYDYNKINTIVIGHEHPAILITDENKHEKFKCFLKGEWQQKELIVIPSFNPLIEGTDVLKEKLLSPFLNDKLNSISNFDVFIAEGNGLYFGQVKDWIKKKLK